MKILKNNYYTEHIDVKSGKKHTCRWCNSIFMYKESDVTIGNIQYSQRESDSQIEGLVCPCCSRFDNLNNGY